MVNAIGTNNINSVQMLNAVNAFRANEKTKETNGTIQDVSDGIDINDTNILKNQNTDEIKEFAKIAGEQNLSDDDIQYGLTYGRSVIADYMI